jgi:hypothetical protein
VERAFGHWLTGRYVAIGAGAENNFSSDNWGSRTETLIQRAAKLDETAWDFIMGEANKKIKPPTIDISSGSESDNGEGAVGLLCSDFTDVLGAPFE